MKRFNPGEKAPQSGSYKVVDRKGRTINTVSVSKNDTLPPTQSKDYCYELDD